METTCLHKRPENMSHADYCALRKRQRDAIRRYLRGRVVRWQPRRTKRRARKFCGMVKKED